MSTSGANHRRSAARSGGDDEPELGPGARALDAHLDAAIGSAPAKRWHPRPRHGRAAEQAPLDQVAARPEGDHWQLTTYGLTEMDAKDSDDPAVSGWGFELGLRVPRNGDEDPPDWAADLLTNLAVYVWTSGHPFAPGHHVAMGGPMQLGASTALTAAVVVADPVVPPLEDGPYGHLELLHLVGVTADELELCRSWSTEGVVDLLARQDRLLVSRLERASVLDDPGLRAEAEVRAGQDGASLTELRVGTVEVQRRWRRAAVVKIGAGASAALGPALRRELVADGASFTVIGDTGRLIFAVGALDVTPGPDSSLRVTLPVERVGDLARLFDGRTGWGRVAGVPGVRFQVIP